MNKIKGICPIVLAGGKSTRMGQNKAFVHLAGKPMIETVLKKITSIFENESIIITNNPQAYKYLGVKLFADVIKDKGPLAGIYTGLSLSTLQHNFICGCDMPFLDGELINYMAQHTDGYDVVIPENNGHLEALHALYSRECLAAIEARLRDDQRKIISFLPDVRVRYINGIEIAQFEDGFRSFGNINSPDDLKKTNK